MIRLPRAGHAAEEILDSLHQLREQDVDWEGGKVWSLVFHPGEELSGFVKEAYSLFFSENALNPTAFPSLRRMEQEVVAMTAALLGGDEEVAGNLTTGGTESILMAMKSARDWARTALPKSKSPEVIVPTTAHPAFDKAAAYFGFSLVHVPPLANGRADVRAMKKAISRNTIALVGSAPQYPHGCVDPIEELAALARDYGLWMHVDACVGGFMLPFVRELGHEVPAFDFGVRGVTSMSVDLHKYAYAAKGASLVLYRDKQWRRHSFTATTDWPGGIYVSPTMTGTRPGGAVAAAWAVMHRIGHDGYLAIAREVMATTQRLRAGIDAIVGVEVFGEPHMSVLAIVSDQVDVYAVGDLLQEQGWHLDRQQSPPSLHLTVNRAHLESTDRFLSDLRAAVAACQRPRRARLAERVQRRALRTAVGVLPSAVTSRLTAVASRVLGVGGDAGLPGRTAPMYGLMATLPNRGDLRELVIDILSDLTLPDKTGERILPDAASGASSEEQA
jgi:glutamate/tyrosine decarboxylase-like PLP-dependent enzyme